MAATVESSAVATSERRTAPRLVAAAVPAITGVRLSPGGGEAWLVNISSSGVLVRCATKLLPGTPVMVTFEGTFVVGSAKGKVARCFVADIGRPIGLSYHIGIAFNESIPFEGQIAETPQHEPEAVPVLVNRW
ncbi:MAG: PilZ domain-containing protein [Vicinamibacterales bacterium]|nr:PilZ domain-containing protein [Vicinamibacterales bacterium]